MNFKRQKNSRSRSINVALVGLGNIGSQLVTLLPGLPDVRRVTLIDKDVYETANLAAQTFRRREVGRPKAEVQARHLRRLAPGLSVRAIHDDLANIPLAFWRDSLVIACLDSLAARIALNQAAWWSGVSWLDAGVAPEQLLARVSAFRPGPASPCFECGLTDQDYSQLQGRQPCQPAGAQDAPTHGRKDLGALAAALVAIEAAKILAGGKAQSLVGRQLVMDAAHQHHFVTALSFNPNCRFSHQTFHTLPRTRLESTRTIADALTLSRRMNREVTQPALHFPGLVFARSLHCLRCGGEKSVFHVLSRLPRRARRCARCGAGAMQAVGFKLVDQLDTRLTRQDAARPLRQVGIRPGDLFTTPSDSLSRACEIV